MDQQPGSGVRAQKKRRDWLIQLVNSHRDWALGYGDETWWSRFAQPRLRVWTEAGKPLRLVEQVKQKEDPDPKALARCGLLVRWATEEHLSREQAWLRFVDGRPVSTITIQFLEWCCAKLHGMGIRVLALIWDNAGRHISRVVRTWIREHNRAVKRSGERVRILVGLLPVKSPWLNPIEPGWMHGKRRVMEPDRIPTAQELAERVCAVFGCAYEEHPSIPENLP